MQIPVQFRTRTGELRARWQVIEQGDLGAAGKDLSKGFAYRNVPPVSDLGFPVIAVIVFLR
jgi:hypothetical protein